MEYKCLYYRICHSYVKLTDKGWVHIPSNRKYWMEHIKYNKRQLKNSMIYKEGREGNGCGWKGAAPTDQLTIKTDICPQCGAVGQLADEHFAQPRYPKRRGRKPANGALTNKRQLRKMIRMVSGAKPGQCTGACRAATNSDCDCICGGQWHGTIRRI